MKRLTLALALLVASCASAADRRSALESLGFTDVELGDLPWFQCGRDDDLLQSATFRARNVRGQLVSGVVCCGAFKGCTVRF